MKVINRGTICCDRCGCKLYDFVEFEDANGGLDGDITHKYCGYSDYVCNDCHVEIENENKGEE